MNKRLLVFIFLILLSGVSFAQFSVGAGGMLNYTGISGEAAPNMKFENAANFGINIFGDYKLNEEIGLSIGVAYARSGVIVAYDFPSYVEPRDSLEASLDYFSFPLSVKFFTSDYSYFLGGFRFALLNDGFAKDLQTGSTSDVKNSVKDYNIAVEFGFGLKLPLFEKWKWFIEGRYSRGVKNVSNISDATNSLFPEDFKSVDFQLMLGVYYDF